MKKITLLVLMVILVGCTCIGQIPDQLAYVDSTCTVPLENYVPMATALDNCDGEIPPVQTPAPGTILNAGDPLTVVTITATDLSGNESSITFNVLAIDTIPPKITLDESLMVFNTEKSGDLMKAQHYYTAHEIQQAIERRPDSALIKYPFLERWDTIYEDYTQVTFFPAGGKGTYLSTWYHPDTYLCGCDSTEYYAQAEGKTVINLQFE